MENSFDPLYKFNAIAHIIDTRGYENTPTKKKTFEVNKSNRKNHTRNFKFHDLKTNRKNSKKAKKLYES